MEKKKCEKKDESSESEKKSSIATLLPPGIKKRDDEDGTYGSKPDEPVVNLLPAASLPSGRQVEVVSLDNQLEPDDDLERVMKAMKFIVDRDGPKMLFHAEFRPEAKALMSEFGKKYLKKLLKKLGIKLSQAGFREFHDELCAHVTEVAERTDSYSRYAPVGNGIEINLCNAARDRVVVTNEGWSLLAGSSRTIFRQPEISEPFPVPVPVGDLSLFQQLLNLATVEFYLLVAWLTYTMSLPKIRGSKYVFLVVNGDQGTGKSFLSHLISKLIDPSALGITAMPAKQEDLGLLLNDCHVVCFDNNRTLSNKVSDLLCRISTGAIETKRRLYTDGGLFVINLHGAVILNGIHDLITQSDLAQRCLMLHLKKIPSRGIISESELWQRFEEDHPAIFAGLLDVIAGAFKALPDAQVLYPERMIDFCRWLAAVEVAMKLEPGLLQRAYSDNLKSAQLDTIQGSLLATSVLDFADSWGTNDYWEGTPMELWQTLTKTLEMDMRLARDFPQNPIALSKRLRGLTASLLTQGIEVEFKRGKERRICITNHNLY